MPTFRMRLIRTAIQAIEIEVEAETSEKAEEKALNAAGDQDFTNKTSDYDYEAEVLPS